MKMETQKKYTAVKKSIPLIKFRKDETDGVDTIEGVFLKRRDAGVSQQEDGTEKARFTLIFQKLDSDEKFQVWETAGLAGAMQMSDVNEGEKVRIVHLGKVKRQGKQGEVNQYDIFSLN